MCEANACGRSKAWFQRDALLAAVVYLALEVHEQSAEYCGCNPQLAIATGAFGRALLRTGAPRSLGRQAPVWYKLMPCPNLAMLSRTLGLLPGLFSYVPARRPADNCWKRICSSSPAAKLRPSTLIP